MLTCRRVSLRFLRFGALFCGSLGILEKLRSSFLGMEWLVAGFVPQSWEGEPIDARLGEVTRSATGRRAGESA